MICIDINMVNKNKVFLFEGLNFKAIIKAYNHLAGKVLIRKMTTKVQNANDAKMQALKFKFNFTTQKDRLIIQAKSSESDQIFCGQIIANPHIDFELIQQLLKEGEYKIMNKTQQLIKIRIGATALELFPKPNLQMKDVKETLKQTLQKQKQLQKIIQTQKNTIDKHQIQITNLKVSQQLLKSNLQSTVAMIKQMKNDFNLKLADMQKQKVNNQSNKNISYQNNHAVQLLKWSKNLKSTFIEILGNIATKVNQNTQNSSRGGLFGQSISIQPTGFFGSFQQKSQQYGNDLALIDTVLSDKKVFWAIKFLKGNGHIGLGICFRKSMQNNRFKQKIISFKGQHGNGWYMIRSNGDVETHSPNSGEKTFSFTAGDTIYFEYGIEIQIKQKWINLRNEHCSTII